MNILGKHWDILPTATAWKRITPACHHGIALPLSALHRDVSAGIGEFLDLLPLVDWCCEIGFDVIQLLPLNDTGTDPSPYNALSSCALHPIFLSLHALPFLEDFPILRAALTSLRRYNTLPRVPYTAILNKKLQWLHDYLLCAAPRLRDNREYQTFTRGADWLETYALFKVLKKQFKDLCWEDWPSKYHNLDTSVHLRDPYREEIELHTMQQFLCFQQLQRVRRYAEQHNIWLMGDIPMCISKDSVDVWQAPHYFDCTIAAGAPPDHFNPEGQYWGFPLFRWENMEQDQYLFWTRRLRTASQFYHIYRIDHAVGFFRIWGIPPHHSCREGTFYPQAKEQWLAQGRRLLTMLATASDMLPIAEDLGVVPKEVQQCIRDLGICGICVPRWQRQWETDLALLPYEAYPVLSMTTLSLHDTPTLAMWWRDYPQEAIEIARGKHWSYTPLLTQEQRMALIMDSHHTPSIFHINLLQEYLALFPELVSDTIDEERINVPGTIAPTNWTYRCRTPIDVIVTHRPLIKALQQLSHKTV